MKLITQGMTMDNSRKGSKNKIKVHYGMKDYYRFFISNFKNNDIADDDNPYLVDSNTFSKIISEANQMVREEILEERYDFKFPYNLGMLGIRKFKPKLGLDDNGKLVNRLPVNPRATRELWDRDEEAKKKKVLVRYTNKHSNGYVFSVHYFKKYKAKFKNKTLYKFEVVRGFKSELAKRVKQGLIDAYLLW